MQLNRKRRRAQKGLLSASCALLGVSQQALADKGDASLQSALSYYSEVGGIQSIEPELLLDYELGDASTLSLNGVADTLTGATPTGASRRTAWTSASRAPGLLTFSRWLTSSWRVPALP